MKLCNLDALLVSLDVFVSDLVILLLVGGFRKRHDAACALKGKRAYLRQAASSSSAPQQPAAAARKQASGVAPGVGQIVFTGSWQLFFGFKKKPRDLQIRCLV